MEKERTITLKEFKDSLLNETPPKGIHILLQAMWHDANGNWEKAHTLAQSVDDKAGAWVHAYLHRKEGDLSNASYWYSRARRDASRTSLEKEWEAISIELLSQ